MFNPIKAAKTEIIGTRTNVREFIAAYKYEKMIAKSQAHLDSIPVVHGHTNVYA